MRKSRLSSEWEVSRNRSYSELSAENSTKSFALLHLYELGEVSGFSDSVFRNYFEHYDLHKYFVGAVNCCFVSFLCTVVLKTSVLSSCHHLQLNAGFYEPSLFSCKIPWNSFLLEKLVVTWLKECGTRINVTFFIRTGGWAVSCDSKSPSFRIYHRSPACFFLKSLRASCPATLILFSLVTVLIFSEYYRLWRSVLRHFLQRPSPIKLYRSTQVFLNNGLLLVWLTWTRSSDMWQSHMNLASIVSSRQDCLYDERHPDVNGMRNREFNTTVPIASITDAPHPNRYKFANFFVVLLSHSNSFILL
jgi:hypothetical protein